MLKALIAIYLTAAPIGDALTATALGSCETLRDGMMLTIHSKTTGNSIVVWTGDIVTSCSALGGE